MPIILFLILEELNNSKLYEFCKLVKIIFCCGRSVKGSNTTLNIKQYFYKQLLKHSAQDWEVYSITIDKLFFRNVRNFLEPHRLYNLLSREIIERINFSFLDDHVQLIVDKCKGKHERSLFDYFLVTNLESKLPINVSFAARHGRPKAKARRLRFTKPARRDV